MNNQELIQKIYEWADARNLIKGSTPLDQGMKLLSELGELADRGLGRNNPEEIIDGIGDVAVVVTVIAGQVGLLERVKEIITNLPTRPENSENDELTSTKQKVVLLSKFISEFIRSADTNQYEALSDKLIPVVLAVLNVIACEENFTLNQCLEHAYNEIKDRKGVLWNGIFVKSTDANYEEVLKQFNESR